jgi:phosphatidylserine decarboxylase
LICPVDGAISQFGRIDRDQIFQAKGHHYSTHALVGGDAAPGRQFQDGEFATLYLSPRDYHRIHMPCDGRLSRMIYVPGALFSVNPTTARGVPGLFARNERVVCVFDERRDRPLRAGAGGRHHRRQHGHRVARPVNPPRPGKMREWDYAPGKVTLKKGDEMGRFLLGSTVVMLFPKKRIRFTPDWAPARAIRMGEAMGRAA